jgi:hypothetical protein
MYYKCQSTNNIKKGLEKERGTRKRRLESRKGLTKHSRKYLSTGKAGRTPCSDTIQRSTMHSQSRAEQV